MKQLTGIGPNHLRHALLGLLVLLLMGAVPLRGAEAVLSDAEKLARVYRMYADYRRDFQEVRDITPHQAMEEMQSGRVVFIDTRKPAEIAVSKLPGAVTAEAWRAQREAYQGFTPIAYCTISYRSGYFAREMAREGVTVYNLTGGLLAWVLEGGKVYDPQGETKRVHVYGKKWDLAPKGYETVKFGFFERFF